MVAHNPYGYGVGYGRTGAAQPDSRNAHVGACYIKQGEGLQLIGIDERSCCTAHTAIARDGNSTWDVHVFPAG